MAAETQLPDWRDQKVLAKWLAQFPRPLIVALSFRIALLSLPNLERMSRKDADIRQKSSQLIKTLRVILVVWVVARYRTREAIAAAELLDTDEAYGVESETHWCLSVSTEHDYNRFAAFAVSGQYGFPEDITLVEHFIKRSLTELISAPKISNPELWFLSKTTSEIGEEQEWFMASLGLLFASLHVNDGWQVWQDWVFARYRGGSDWPELVYDELVKWRSEWKRPPAEINRDIASLLAKHVQKQVSATTVPASQVGIAAADWDFFLSYSNKDEAAAKAIDDILRAAGYRVFFQLRNMDTGASYIQRMKQGLKTSKRLIAVMSPDYEDSPHCQNEWGAFYDKDPSFNQRLMVHLVVRGPITDRIARQSVYVSVEKLSGGDLAKAVLRAIEHKHT